MEGFGWYTYEICKRLVENHPEHTFIFFFDRKYDPKFIFGKNVVPVVLSPQARHPILHYLWFEFAVTKALKKYQADVFFSPDGYLSLRTNVRQINTIHDLNFEHYPQDLPFLVRKYYRYFFPKFAQKATKILTVSEYSKQDICQMYDIPESKIRAIWNGASPAFKPLDENSCLSVKNEYSSGNEYFIFVGSLNPRKNLKRLIEAFHLYKTKFTEGYDLVIVGEKMWSTQDQGLSISPQFANHIHFTGHLSLEKLTQVMGAAACLTFVPYFEGFGIPLVEAMQCGIPVIAGNKTSLPEIVGDAGILVDPFSVEEITAAMEGIYTNKNLRSELKAKGLEQAKLFSWDKSSEAVWEEIESILKAK